MRLSQTQLADFIGVSYQTINTWENNPPKKLDAKKLKKLSIIFKCSVSELFDNPNIIREKLGKYPYNPLEENQSQKIESNAIENSKVEEGENMRQLIKDLIEDVSNLKVEVKELRKENAHLKEELAKAKSQNFAQG